MFITAYALWEVRLTNGWVTPAVLCFRPNIQLLIEVMVADGKSVLAGTRNPRGRSKRGVEEEERSLRHVIALETYFCRKRGVIAGGIVN